MEPRVHLGWSMKRNGGWWSSGFVKPHGRYWKRLASKKVRRVWCGSGGYYKKVWGWFEWS